MLTKYCQHPDSRKFYYKCFITPVPVYDVCNGNSNHWYTEPHLLVLNIWKAPLVGW